MQRSTPKFPTHAICHTSYIIIIIQPYFFTYPHNWNSTSFPILLLPSSFLYCHFVDASTKSVAPLSVIPLASSSSQLMPPFLSQSRKMDHFRSLWTKIPKGVLTDDIILMVGKCWHKLQVNLHKCMSQIPNSSTMKNSQIKMNLWMFGL